MSDLRETVITYALPDVYAPCCADRGQSIVDMGPIDDIRIDGDGSPVARERLQLLPPPRQVAGGGAVAANPAPSPVRSATQGVRR